MTAKKKTLIELMLDAGIKPEDIDERIEFFVSDEPDKEGESYISGYSTIPKFMGKTNDFHYSGYIDSLCKTPYHPDDQGNQIVTKQQFVDAYNEKQFNERKQQMNTIPEYVDARAMNKGVTNIAEDKQVEDIEPCMVVDNSAYDCESTDDTGISLSFEEADKIADNYTSLSNVLRRAYDQASSGKGQERHGQDLPFTKQPMQLIQDLCGEGFALGQAMKKMQESQRLPHDAAIRELLGAINYIAGAIIHKEKLQGSK